MINETLKTPGSAAGSSSAPQVLRSIKQVIIYVVLSIGAVIVLIPFLWSLSTSLKIPSQISTFPPQWIPNPVAWWNYTEALSVYPFDRWFFNTVFIVVMATFGTMLSASLVAFSFARLRWPGRDIFFMLLLTTMMLPAQVTLIPTYILFKEMGWINTFYPLIVPAFFARNAFYVFLLRQFFLTIPIDLDDAAHLDGAGHWQVYWYLILPMSKPALGVGAIMFAQFKWKEFLAPLIFLHRSEMYTLALGLRSFVSQTWGIEWNYLMAANIVFMLPLVIIFFFAQRYFIQGVVITGLKG